MRVVAGSAKGRHLKSPKSEGTRPVMDRVKTALFDILAPRIVGTRFLDLFGGSGGIGIEALSRGARSATFIELNPAMVKLIRENLAITRLAENAEALRVDAFRFLENAASAGRRYDIVYVAPPQYQGMAARAVAQLDRAPLTEDGGLVIAQIHPRERDTLDALPLRTLRLVDERRYGSTLLLFYQRGLEEDDEAGGEDETDETANERDAANEDEQGESDH
jgi:16S rRNA (guanine(966)-N(2))-methyltransferase RsmD